MYWPKFTYFCKSRRSVSFLCVVSLIVLAIYLTLDSELLVSLMQPSNLKWIMEGRGFLLNTPGCQIPDWNPFDPSVSRLIKRKDGPYECPGKPPLLRSGPNSVISIDYDILSKHYGEQRENVFCTYRPILRNPRPDDKNPDNRYSFGSYKKLYFDIPLGDEFVVVNCSLKHYRNFTQFIPLVPLKDETEHVKSEKSKVLSQETHLNVIILGIDSISKLNFLRHFPKTYKFMKENLSYYELRGYTKVGDNTFPNLVPLFTGHFMEECWNGSTSDIFFDDDTQYIWKNYSAKGYRTFFAEDAPNIATFNYEKKGFRNPPTDYYYRPFALAIEKIIRTGKYHCLDSVFEMDVLFNYLRDSVMTMGERPFFAYTFATRLTHDVLNDAGYADEPTFHLIKDLHSEGILNKSLLIFFSDHGIRFGSIRQTYIGKFEERMPFIFLFFPAWFRNKYPDFEKNLQTNQHRLTTPFDVHATLVHLLHLNRKPSPELSETLSRVTPHGVSLMDPVPIDRTCETASIRPHWCTCQTHKPIPVTDPITYKCAIALVDAINEILTPFSDKCVPLTLSDITDARFGQISDVVLRFMKKKKSLVPIGKKIKAPFDYLITIRVDPSKAVFEGTVRYDDEADTYKVLDDISRLNKYGDQSICVTDARLKKFCYCLSQAGLL